MGPHDAQYGVVKTTHVRVAPLVTQPGNRAPGRVSSADQRRRRWRATRAARATTTGRFMFLRENA